MIIETSQNWTDARNNEKYWDLMMNGEQKSDDIDQDLTANIAFTQV